ncbi:hypothetical protein M431DRAFT_322835 [Trichoderma harzianum CBS 226.95]|uniref:Uncharacterized protein n=1 Tax=Trichoderma harzianum CBS 226.95 TaxID=983964 RepID=A0A2T3ZUY7_TRIHA|nr:hypothetical protein M431DRAFT_322835 [Trichoderma harzianum CBS 226.95]PTB48635.1 hypothetical protein M431DRAFT_322835 [Trichoderma harzianum CBS 226.95]
MDKSYCIRTLHRVIALCSGKMMPNSLKIPFFVYFSYFFFPMPIRILMPTRIAECRVQYFRLLLVEPVPAIQCLVPEYLSVIPICAVRVVLGTCSTVLPILSY